MKKLAILKLFLLMVFLGWLFIWIMLPTKLYKNTWSPKLNSQVNSSTYFGGQGTNLLLFSFPMMFIAVMACIYLHYSQKPKMEKPSFTNTVVGSKLCSLRRPVMVVAPLGIVTAVEMIFGVMFITLLIWSLANYLYVSFGHLMMHKADEKVWQGKFRSVSLRLGYIGNICWAFLFIPVTRGSSILPLVGLTSESSIKYHIWLGHTSMLLFFAHTIGFIIYWAMTDQLALMLEWSKTWVSNVAGEIAIVFALAMWVTSLPRIRRRMFELFFYTHYLYILYIVFYVLHVGAAYFCLILPNIFLFAIDRYLRFLQSRHRARLLCARLLPCGSVELNFSKSPGLYYNPTSILFLNVPSISKLQWHPFTVSSNCNLEADKLSVVIKRQGSWSQKLFQQISSGLTHLQVSVEGPYGPSTSNFLRHELLVLVSGGSGITPFISIIREIIFQSTDSDCKLPQVLLICAFKNSADLAMLDLLFPVSSTPTATSQLQLRIEAYITGEKEQPLSPTQELIHTTWFKPSPSDLPVAATLGPNNWLWLGAIIVSSFMMFLLVLGLVSRYYIFPMDHNSNKIYHFSYFVLWDMFLACACVFAASSVAFVLRKKENSMEGKQIQNLKVPTPTASPGSWFYSADRELESHPHQSLVKATNVQFGSRPDLKRILFGCKESDVGVLACGPKTLRHEVANICASGLARNLHFESISFNW